MGAMELRVRLVLDESDHVVDEALKTGGWARTEGKPGYGVGLSSERCWRDLSRTGSC